MLGKFMVGFVCIGRGKVERKFVGYQVLYFVVGYGRSMKFGFVESCEIVLLESGCVYNWKIILFYEMVC